MYYTEQKPTVIRIMKILYRTGIWQNGNESRTRKLVRTYLILLYCVLFQVFNNTCAYLSEDMNETIFLTEIGMFYAVITFKQFYLLWKKKEIKSFLNDPITSHLTRYGEASELVNKKLHKFMRFIHAYLWMLGVTSTFIAVSCFPMFTNGKKLPFFISYPFEWMQSETIYWIMYAFVGLAIFYGYLFNLVTIFIWYLMFHYSVAYELLGYELRKLGHTSRGPKAVGWYDVKADSTLYELQFIDSVKTHKKLFKTIKRFKSCFYALFLIQMTTSGISICVSTYNMAYSSHENIIQSVIFIVVLLYGVFDIFLVMYLANAITWASEQLSKCIYDSNWVEQCQRCKNAVLIIGEIFKQPQHLVVLIFPMNLQTFTSIITGAYRMFNILKRFEK